MPVMFDSPSAMAEFFTDSVAISRAAGGETTVPACVLDMGLDAPIGQNDAEPGLAWWSVRVHAADLGGVPRIRDIVRFIDGRTASVARISRENGDYELVCRGKR